MSLKDQEIQSLKTELAHWKANHADIVNRLRIATQRPDLPVDRIPAIEELKRLQERVKYLESHIDWMYSPEYK